MMMILYPYVRVSVVDCGDKAADWLCSFLNMENIRLVHHQFCDVDVVSCVSGQQSTDDIQLISAGKHEISDHRLDTDSGWLTHLCLSVVVHVAASVILAKGKHFVSESELKFMFAIYRHPSVCRLSVCNVRAPYSDD